MKKESKPTKKELETARETLETWYVAGWSVNPKSLKVAEATRLIDYLAVCAHLAWQNRICRGEAPAEDVSPAEGFILLALFVRHLASVAKVRSVRCDLLMKEFYGKEKRTIDKISKKILEKVNGTSK